MDNINKDTNNLDNKKYFELDLEVNKKYIMRDITITYNNQKDSLYFIEEHFFSNKNNYFDKIYFDKICDLYKKTELIRYDDNSEVVFYSPELCYILTTTQPVLLKEAIYQLCCTEDNSVTYAFSPELISIDNKPYLKSYIEGFTNGIKDFDNNYSTSIQNQFLFSDQNLNKFIDNLKRRYYIVSDENVYFNQSCSNIKDKYPQKIYHKIIFEFGFNSGLLYQFDKLQKTHPKIFEKIQTPFFYTNEEINDSSFWKLTYQMQKSEFDYEISKKVLYDEFERIKIDKKNGVVEMATILSEIKEQPEKRKITVEHIDNKIRFIFNILYPTQFDLLTDDIKLLNQFYNDIYNEITKGNNANKKTKKKSNTKKKNLKTAIECIILEIPEQKEIFLMKLKQKYCNNTNIKQFAKIMYVMVHKGIIDINITPRNVIKPAFEKLFDKEIEYFGNQKGFDKHFRDFNKWKEKSIQVFNDEFSTLINEINQLKQEI